MTGSWTQSFCSSVRIQIHGLSGYHLLQFWSYRFNILYDVYTHNGGVHVHRILMVRRGHHLCLTDTLHFQQITPNKTTLSIVIKSRGILLFQLSRVTRQVPIMEQELSTRVHHSLQFGQCCLICSFLCSVLQIVVCPFALFLQAIVLHILL